MKRRNLFLFTILLIAVATLCKFFFAPKLEWSGFSPVIAIALFSGMIVKDRKSSFLLPLIALFASDVLIEIFYRVEWFPFAGFYKHQWVNYTLLLLVTLIGWALKGKNMVSLFAGAVIAPTVFFLLSNFSSWMFMDLYPKTTAGLLQSYTAGLPFYKHALSATIVFLPLISFAYNYLTKNKTAVELA